MKPTALILTTISDLRLLNAEICSEVTIFKRAELAQNLVTKDQFLSSVNHNFF